MADIEIKKATADDAELILRFITDLAIYEKAEHEVVATESDIKKSLFSESSTVQALICYAEGEPVGFAVYFFNYSTWLGINGLFLEDLYVSPESRGTGAGKALLKYLAGIAIEKGAVVLSGMFLNGMNRLLISINLSELNLRMNGWGIVWLERLLKSSVNRLLFLFFLLL